MDKYQSLPNTGQPPVPPTETPLSSSPQPTESPDINQPVSQFPDPQTPPFPRTGAQQQNQNLSQPQMTVQSPTYYQKPEPVQQNTYNKGFTQKEIKPITWRAWAKLAFIAVLIITSIRGTLLISRNVFMKTAGGGKKNTLFQTRYQPVLWKDFGEVFEPIVKIPLYYPEEGFIKHEFLLDSGALVSSLPREEAKKMGFSLAKLKRSTFGGFGGTTSFAYKADAKIKLGDEEIKIPVVFTEAGGTKAILGRSGFFENYSIYFNSTKEMIEISK